jgi:hypothetical protein
MSLNKFSKIWGVFMAYQSAKKRQAQKDDLPKVILIESQNDKVDGQKKSEEILYYLTQIILLADKKGRPLKDFFPEVQDAA